MLKIIFFILLACPTLLFANNQIKIGTANGGWNWFAVPRAVHFNGTNDRTYIGTADGATNVKVIQFDHTTKAVTTTILNNSIGIDDHNDASFFIRKNDNRIIAFYSTHDLDNVIRYRLSTNPEDSTSWGAEQTITVTDKLSYPQPIWLENENKLYLFYRQGITLGLYNRWNFNVSSDNGDTWGESIELINIPDIGTDNEYNQYMLSATNETDTIWFIHSGHPQYETDTKIYAFYYKGENYYKSDGTLIGGAEALPLDRSDMTVVYDPTSGESERGWIIDLQIKNNTPYILFETYPSQTAHRYYWGYWNGSTWITKLLVNNAGTYMYSSAWSYGGGMSLDSNNPDTTVYLGYENGGIRNIYKSTTSDGGNTWKNTILSDSDLSLSSTLRKVFRPVSPKNSNSEISVLWLSGRYDQYKDYSLDVYYSDGENGTLSGGVSIIGGVQE